MKSFGTWRASLLAASAIGIAAGLASCSSDPPEAPEIRTVSNRADLVSGGDTLVEIMLPAGAGTNGRRSTRARQPSTATRIKAPAMPGTTPLAATAVPGSTTSAWWPTT